MDYNSILEESHNIPTKNFNDLIGAIEQAVAEFETNNPILENIQNGSLKIPHYHNLLLTLFHQVWVGPGTFAVAGGQMKESMSIARDYLMHHADEEKLHWTWIISDLRKTGYSGPDPRQMLPSIATQAYLSYATFLAFRFPLGRLAMAAVLEGISGKFGGAYGKKLATLLKLRPEQLQFFLAHGELDQGHSEDIFAVLKRTNISGEDMAKMCHVAKCTEALYKNMYITAFNEAI